MSRTSTVLAYSTALAATAVLSASPAQADTNTDFLRLLSNAGIGYSNATDTAALGRSVCDMLVEPGKSFASTVTRVRNNGVPPEMAAFFAGIAIQAYCPQMLASVADGTVLDQLDGLNGLNGLTGAGWWPGLSGLWIPGQ